MHPHEVQANQDVFGVDRHGTVAVRKVDVAPLSDPADNCFVGTRSCFGAFHRDTNLVTSAGAIVQASKIAARDQIDDLNFEAVTHAPTFPLSSTATEILWEQLSLTAVCRSKIKLLFRAVAAKGSHSDIKEWCQVEKKRGSAYAIVSKEPFEKVLRSRGTSTLIGLLRLCFGTTDGQIEIERAHYALMLWIASLNKGNSTYRLLFDSRQHTASVAIALDQSSTSIERVRTAFVGENTRALQIRWSERDWNPISSGFVVASN